MTFIFISALFLIFWVFWPKVIKTIADGEPYQGIRNIGYAVSIPLYLVIFAWNIFTVVDPGYAGVVITFGTVSEGHLENGLNVISPVSGVSEMEVRLQEYTMSNKVTEGKVQGADAITAQAKDGLMMDMEKGPLPATICTESITRPAQDWSTSVSMAL